MSANETFYSKRKEDLKRKLIIQRNIRDSGKESGFVKNANEKIKCMHYKMTGRIVRKGIAAMVKRKHGSGGLKRWRAQRVKRPVRYC